MKKVLLVKKQNGYIALISTITLSFLIVSIVTTLGFSSFFSRFDILDSESKEKSYQLALSCINWAILESAYGNYYKNYELSIDSDSCVIKDYQINYPVSEQITLFTQSVVNKSFTNLKAVVSLEDFSVILLKECANIDESC
ncbi:MAG: hypothetical protein FJZ43_03525 [Candidatus Staskawiczbacteria bacterium]|nr:hypothetical protein [Candidatus Staskawiczbacteria bacterium]